MRENFEALRYVSVETAWTAGYILQKASGVSSDLKEVLTKMTRSVSLPSLGRVWAVASSRLAGRAHAFVSSSYFSLPSYLSSSCACPQSLVFFQA